MPAEPQPTGPVEVFYSYAHEDEKLKDELLKHLSNIERQGLIVSWHDRDITPGREWAGAIDEHIETAGLILLLVSPDFMSSGYCNDVELKRAMQRHDAGEARVIPVILRPVDWKGSPFEKLRALPTDGRPVTRRRNHDDGFLEVAQGVREAVEELARRSSHTAAPKPREPLIPRPPVVGFVARRDERGRDIVATLREELEPEKNRLVALWGPGGVGKSTLAAEVVRTSAGTFKGRVAWVSAFGRAEFSLATLLDEVATQLGREDLRKLAPEPKAAQVGALVSEAATLVILDNFETVSEEEQTRCLDFLARAAACPALITTRYFIDRDDVHAVALAAMSSEEARDFLQRLIENTGKHANFNGLDRDDLIRRCESNPLVLQWVVRQIVLAKRPQAVLDELARGEGDAAERVFTRSFNLPQLGDDGRAALQALSLFTPSAAPESLGEVAGFGADLRRLDASLRRLSALWLVETTEGNERLFLRGLTRELAKSRMAGAGLAAEFRGRYIAHYVGHAGGHAEWTPQDFTALENELDNLLGALDAGYEMRDWKSVMRIRYQLDGFLILRGYWDEAVRSGELAAAAAREADNQWNVAYFKTCVAEIWLGRGEYDKAEEVYRSSLKVFRALKSDINVARCLHYIGLIMFTRGELDEALRLHKQTLRIMKKLGHENHVASSTSQIGIVLNAQGKVKESKAKHEASLAIRRKLDDQPGIAIDLHQLGVIAESQNDFAEARRLYAESLEIERGLGNKSGIARTLGNLGLLTEKEGDRVEAVRLLRDALDILEKLGSDEVVQAREQLRRVESSNN